MIIILPSFGVSWASPIDVNIPPTRAFAKISDGTSHVTAKNYLGQINVTGGSGITVSVTNGTTAPKITITNTASSGLSKIQGSNLGTHGIGPFASNFNASMLQFLSVVSGNSNCVVSSNSTNIILTCTGGAAGVSSAIGGGSVTVSPTTGDIVITGKTYQNNTGTNLGTSGTSIYTSNSGSALQFLKLISANSNCAFSANSTNVILTCVTQSDVDPAPKVSINGNNRTSFIGIIANQTFAAPKISINGNNRSSFISVANTTSANTINGHLVSFPSSNSGTILLGNGSGSSLTGIILSSLSNLGHISTAPLNTGTILDTNGTFAGTLGALLANTFSYLGHVITIPSNTGTMLLQNGTGAYLTQNVRAISAGTNISVNGTTGTVSVSVTGVPTLSGNNIWTGTNQWTSSGALYENPAKTFATTLAGGAVTANRTLNLPAITGTDTLGALGFAQNWSGDNIFSGNVDFHDGGTKTDKFDSGNMVIRNPAATFGYSIIGSAITANRSLTLPLTTQTETFAVKPVINFTSSANKTGTSTFTMLGDGVTLTPTVTGRAEVSVSGYTTTSVAASGGQVQIRQITGGCPGNGATVTGTAIGSNIKVTEPASTSRGPFAITVQVTGLTLGQKYCFELTQQAITSGTFTVFNVMWSAKEL